MIHYTHQYYIHLSHIFMVRSWYSSHWALPYNPPAYLKFQVPHFPVSPSFFSIRSTALPGSTSSSGIASSS